MDSINLKQFKRVTDLSDCFDIRETTTLVKEDISIIFPEIYIKKKLCIFKDNVYLCCYFAFLDKSTNRYAVSRIPVGHNFSPTERVQVVVNDEPYIELIFKAGDILTPLNKTVKSFQFLFTLFELFFLQGKIPKFLNYDDLGKLFLESTKYTGIKVGDNAIANEILASMTARYSKDLNVFFKEVAEGVGLEESVMIGLNDSFYGFDNTTSRLIGNYLADCMNNAIIDPDDEPNKIGYILKQ